AGLIERNRGVQGVGATLDHRNASTVTVTRGTTERRVSADRADTHNHEPIGIVLKGRQPATSRYSFRSAGRLHNVVADGAENGVDLSERVRTAVLDEAGVAICRRRIATDGARFQIDVAWNVAEIVAGMDTAAAPDSQ